MRSSLWISRPCLLGVCLALALAAGACATKQPPPLVPAMVPISANGDYGYSEAALGPDLYTISFVTPSLSAPGDPDQDYGLGGQKHLVSALVTWRAAQLALEKGYPAFQVQNETRDVNVHVEEPPSYPPYVSAPMRTMQGSPCRWDCDRPIGYWGDPYNNPIYDDWYRRGHTSGRVIVNLTVKLLPAASAGALDAVQTAERYRTAYGTATFNVQ